IRALRQFSFGCFVRRTRRMKTARKKRCAIPLTRSKELFQPDARSDLLLLGPGLRPGRCGWVGSPEGVGRGVETPSLPLWPSGAPTPTKKRPFPGAPCVCIIFVKMNFEKIRFLPFRAGSRLPANEKRPLAQAPFLYGGSGMIA